MKELGDCAEKSDISFQQMSCIQSHEGILLNVQTCVSFAFTHPLVLHLSSQCTEQITEYNLPSDGQVSQYGLHCLLLRPTAAELHIPVTGG
jgi:hypothetical protein